MKPRFDTSNLRHNLSKFSTLTPILDFLENYSTQDKIRLHMPGHKGNHFHSILHDISRYDITEIEGADVLFSEDKGIIDISEQIATEIFGTKATLFSTGGSTLSIQSMLATVLRSGDSVIVSRNAHVAFINSCVLLDLNPIWVLPRYNDNSCVSGQVSADDIRNTIIRSTATNRVEAVYITTPDYMGSMCDVSAISKVCVEFNIPLLVDNAHGSHLIFCDDTKGEGECQSLHPIHQGASLCVDSAHKTLPVLTGGGYLHISKCCNTNTSLNITKGMAKKAMALFGSTSPSYLTLLSLDLCNQYLMTTASKDFTNLKNQIKILEDMIVLKGGTLISASRDFSKLTIDCFELGITVKYMLDILSQHHIEVEYSSHRHIVLMYSPFNRDSDFDTVYQIINSINSGEKIADSPINFSLPQRIMSPRDAYFANTKKLPIDECNGEIVAENKILCPPGVPIVVCGEKIDNNSLKILKNYSILSLNVVE